MTASHCRRSAHRAVLSLVERGWSGARTCSLSLNAMEIPVTHLIKGSLPADLCAMIAPAPFIRLVSVPRMLFRVWLWGLMGWQTLTGQLRWIVIDQERTLREVAWWCRLFRLTPVMVHETDEGYTLEVRGARAPFTAVFGGAS